MLGKIRQKFSKKCIVELQKNYRKSLDARKEDEPKDIVVRKNGSYSGPQGYPDLIHTLGAESFNVWIKASGPLTSKERWIWALRTRSEAGMGFSCPCIITRKSLPIRLAVWHGGFLSGFVERSRSQSVLRVDRGLTVPNSLSETWARKVKQQHHPTSNRSFRVQQRSQIQ